MNARRSRPHGIIARILGGIVEQPQPRRAHTDVDHDWPMPPRADWTPARIDLAWGPAQTEALR